MLSLHSHTDYSHTDYSPQSSRAAESPKAGRKTKWTIKREMVMSRGIHIT